jgi:hypothetical protein
VHAGINALLRVWRSCDQLNPEAVHANKLGIARLGENSRNSPANSCLQFLQNLHNFIAGLIYVKLHN